MFFSSNIAKSKTSMPYNKYALIRYINTDTRWIYLVDGDTCMSH